MAAAGVNDIDVYHRTGAYPLPTPFIVGAEGAGVMSAVGTGVTGCQVGEGDHVGWAMVPGAGYATQVIVPAERAVPVPDGIDDETAGAVLLQGLTAQYLTRSTYPAQPGETALVHAAAGGVGLLFDAGADHPGCARDRDDIDRGQGGPRPRGRCRGGHPLRPRGRGLGGLAAHRRPGCRRGVRRRGTRDLRRKHRQPAPARDVRVVWRRECKVAPVDPQLLQSKGSLFFTRPTPGHHVAARDELLERSREVFAWVASGELAVRVGARYTLEQARQAHQDLEGRRTTGKSLIIPA